MLEPLRIHPSVEVPTTRIREGLLRLNVDGFSRPTHNSIGSLIHWSEEGARNFWRWFSTSKLVGTDGCPLVAFHGTNKSFDRFRPGESIFEDGSMFFSSSPKTATAYAKSSAGRWRTGSNVLAVYLHMNNPLIIDCKGGSDIDGLMDAREQALNEGRDGVVAMNVDDGYGLATQLVVFSGHQVMSALGNSGLFRPGGGLTNRTVHIHGSAAAVRPALSSVQPSSRPRMRR